MTTQYVDAAEFLQLQREHTKLKEEHRGLFQAASRVQAKAYEEGRESARREYLRANSHASPAPYSEGLAHLNLPDNGGCIQFHVVGPSPARPLTGGMESPDPDYMLRIWGPPDAAQHYGVHEQGGGNRTDFSMLFDLTPEGIVIHRMDVTGLRTKWSK